MKFEKLENIALALTVVCSLLTSGAAAQTKPAVELEAAMTKEQVNGDLKAAIEAYQKIAGDAAAPRFVRAKALLHLAGCYEKLGQEAQKVYQQIVRDFGDQPAASQARTRLAALQKANRAFTPRTMTQRKIAIPKDMSFGPSDTDGRRVVYLSNTPKELIYADLVTGTRRVVFKAEPNAPIGWFPSRDFSMVAVMLYTMPRRLAVIKTDGTGYRELMRDDAQRSVFGDGHVAEWSWDNRYLLFRSSKRILVISVDNGERRELLSLDSALVTSAKFSPDGRFVAFKVREEERPLAGPVSKIFVLPSRGGEPHLLYEEPASEFFRELDWTADGGYLAIASMRSGKAALHLLPVKDGQSAGTPLFVRYGNIEAGYSNNGGSFIYSTVKRGGYVTAHIAPLDLNGRPGNWQPLELRGDNKISVGPQWSPDGSQIVYIVSDERKSQAIVRDVSTGGERELYAGPVGNCIWAAQQGKIFCIGDLEAGKRQLLSIAADSGESERLGPLAGGARLLAQPSRDGQAVYYWSVQSDVAKLVRQETATGQQTILAGTDSQLAKLSPEEHWLYTVSKRSLQVFPLAGGNWKTVATLSEAVGAAGNVYSQFDSTPDGKWIVFHDFDIAGNHGLFRVPTVGGPPERLGDFPVKDLNGTLNISPDGRKLMIASCNCADAFDLWSLENFVPPAPKN